MAKKTPPEVHLHLAGGSLKIETPEVIYHISAAAPSAAQALPAPVEKAPLLLEADEREELYKDLSEEMYQELGGLARRLAVSLRDLRVDPSELDLVASGERLENAKDELASVVDMTEKATMNIMDLTDKIQADCQAAQDSLSTLQDVQVMELSERDGFLELLDRLVEAQWTARPLLGQALSQAEETLVFLTELNPGPEPQSLGAAKAEAGQRVVFPLNDLFQILYELCANDDVKKNIKAIWNKMDEFDEAKVNEALRQGADDFERDEEFVMVPLEPLFKSLFLSTDNKPFKETIKTLNSARTTLFLDQSLPVEVRYEEAPAEVEEAPPPEAEEAEAAPEPEKAEAEPGPEPPAEAAVPEPEEAPAKMEQDDVEALLAEAEGAEAEPPAKEEPKTAAAEPLGQNDVEALLAETGGTEAEAEPSAEPEPETAAEPPAEAEAEPPAEAEPEAAAETEPAEAEPEPEETPVAAPPDELQAKAKAVQESLTTGAAQLREQMAQHFDWEPDKAILERIRATVFVQGSEQDQLTQALDGSQTLVMSIYNTVNGIIEALSFQDLAGQRIQKIVTLLSEYQIELLKILVAFHSRLRVEKEQPKASAQEKEDLAQRDVDEVLTKLGLGEIEAEVDLTAGPEASGRLDQGSIDEMLDDLGF